MGSWKAIIPFVLALIIAVGGGIFIYKWIRAQTAPKEAVKVETEAVPVVVAMVDMQWGTKVNAEMLKTLPFFRDSLPPGYFSDPGKVIGRVVIAPKIKQNEPVTEFRLAPESVKVGGVSAVVTPGKRAISVKGDKVLGIAGFINPGNRVDVLITISDPRKKSKETITKVVFENMLVLATGTQVHKDEKGNTSPVDVYTLEVTPEEGEKLCLAAMQGKLQFALRNTTDDKTVLTKGAYVPQLLASYTKKEPKRESKKRLGPSTPKVQARTFTVEIIKGGNVVKKKFKL